MKKLFLLLTIAIAGCESLGLKDQNRSLTVADCSKPEVFVVENKGTPGNVAFTITGNVNQEAQLLWTDKAPVSDTVFTASNIIKLPAGQVNAFHSGDYYSKKLYVKYVPLSDSTTGNIQVGIRIQ